MNPALHGSAPTNYIPFTEIPEEVHRAAETLHSYFERQGMREWQFAGVADRRLVNTLEHDKDAAIASVVELHAAMIGYEGGVDGEASSEHRRMMERAAALLPENT